MLAMVGRKMSWPAAAAELRMPITRPRFLVNQRVATVAASTFAAVPVPVPTTTPHSNISCQDSRMNVVSATPVPISVIDASISRRMPKRSIIAAANGPISPNSTRLTATANEMVLRLQWNSCSNGTMRMPGVERTPAPSSNVRNVAPATTQA